MKVLRYLSAIAGLILFFSGTLFAYDTDLYMATGTGVEPNILIIFDNSGSMNEKIPVIYYNWETEYDPVEVALADKGKVYYQTWWGTWSVFKNSIDQVSCLDAQTTLTYNGHYEGNTNVACDGKYYTLRTGNYRNYLKTDGVETKAKLEIAKDVIKDFLTTINGVKVGVMIFNHSEGGRLQDYEKTQIRSLTTTVRTELKTAIGNITAGTWTPLAETLYEAGLYFKGTRSYFNSGVDYSGMSPIEFHCQKNYVIIMTDGEPTQDRNSVLKYGDTETIGGVTYTYPKIGDQDGDKREPGMASDPDYPSDGSDYLDDVARYLYGTDLRDLTGQQNIITYTIGFAVSSSLLERTATQGHGKYFYSASYQALANAFQNIIGEILGKATSFVAPIVPVSRLERTTAGDKIYLAFFKPISNQMWNGNIKKYGVAQSDNPSLGIYKGDIIDRNDSKAIDDSNGQFYSTARSFWASGSMDGSEVEKGGVGEVLMSRDFASNPRKIYTYFYTNVSLNHTSNEFSTGNGSITPAVLGLPDTEGRDNLIKFVHGHDAYDDNSNGNKDEKRDWILGSFLHSRPLIIHYPNATNPDLTRSVIFAGSNGGMLHAFDDSDGRELWGFIPRNLLGTLKALHADVLATYVDGSPRAYITYKPNGEVDQAILIFGQRRGGDRYYALDVSYPDSPSFLWEISTTKRVYQTTTTYTTDYQKLGQTWSSPVIGKIAYGAGEKWVAFIGGGHDTKEDADPVTASDTVGLAVYVVDVLNGSLVKRFSIDDSGYAEMTYSIASDIAKVDTDGNGKVDRLYVGDLGGRIWRFDIGNSDVNQWTGTIIFKSNPGASDRRKIFYPPDVTLERDAAGPYEMLFFGTGDREAPKEGNVANRLYAVKDRFTVTGGVYSPSAPLEETDLVNVTNGLAAGTQVPNGWRIILEHTSEKCLATPVVFYKTIYFTTFTASAEGQSGDPCYVGEGTGRLYALRYNTGNAVFNFDLTNDIIDETGKRTAVLAKSDRSLIMGSAIPSGVIITFVGGTAVAYAGVGGGVFSPELESTNPLVPMTWRIVF